MNKPSWKSVVFDELHAIREKITLELKELPMEEWTKYWIEEVNKRLRKDGYKYEKSTEGYEVLKKI